MKVLGLSFGRKGKNCDILVKEALFGAQAKGAEISFINMMNLKIGHCTGCGACDKRRENGGPSRCVIKDDFPFVEDAILEHDLVRCAPHFTAERIDFKDKLSLSGTADGRIARHIRNGVIGNGEEHRPASHACSGKRCLTAGMSCADHDDVGAANKKFHSKLLF